jgi:nicotinamidase-related amidase
MIKPMAKVLVVIDVQNHFAVEKAAELPQKIVEYIKNSKYDYLVLTLFHNDPKSNFHKILHWHKAMESPAIDIHPLLAPYSTKSNTFDKITYSAFKAPGFVNFLNKHKINELDICGIDIDGCVLATAYEAFDLGYKVKILEDLSSVASNRQDYEDSAKVIIARNLKRKEPKD